MKLQSMPASSLLSIFKGLFKGFLVKKQNTQNINKVLKSLKSLYKTILEDYEDKSSSIKDEYKAIRNIIDIVLKELENLQNITTLDDIDKILKLKTLHKKILSFDSLRNQRADELLKMSKESIKDISKLLKTSSFATLICHDMVKLANEVLIENSLFIEVEDDEDEN